LNVAYIGWLIHVLIDTDSGKIDCETIRLAHVNHARIRYWNKSILNNKGKYSC